MVGWFVGTIHFVLLHSFSSSHGSFGIPTGPLASILTRSISCALAVLALEAVLLTSFVLIRQNAMDQVSRET